MAQLPSYALRLGLAGLLPQALAVLMLVENGELRWTAQAMGYGYGALILSFLGGIWWGLALRDSATKPWIYIAAVLPSLIAFATYLPWIVGKAWPQPSLLVLSLCIAASPLVDQKIGGLPQGWMKLRWTLSLGLAFLTAILALG
jgi:Protein of unknown function (DUF3429)